MSCYNAIFILFIIIGIIIVAYLYDIITSGKDRGRPCQKDSDCKSNLVCQNNVCTFSPVSNTTTFPNEKCYALNECPLQYYCASNNICLAGPGKTVGQDCQQDQECQLGLFCSCSRVCTNISSDTELYYTNSQNVLYQVNDELFINGPDDNQIIQLTDDPQDTDKYSYDPKIKFMNNKSSTDMNSQSSKSVNNNLKNSQSSINNNFNWVTDKSGLIRSSIFSSSKVFNQYYLRQYTATEQQNIFPETNGAIYCLIDQFGNTFRLTSDQHIAVCQDNINYPYGPVTGCQDSETLFLQPVTELSD